MYYDFFETGLIGTLTLVGDETGLRYIDFQKTKTPTTIQDDWKKKPEFFPRSRPNCGPISNVN